MECELLKILVERTSYINNYWNFYIVVATAIIGTIASGKITITRTIRIIMTVTFLLFAASNFLAICDVNSQRNALAELIKSYPTIISTLKPKPFLKYVIFHILLDCVVLIAIWNIRPNSVNGNKDSANTSSASMEN